MDDDLGKPTYASSVARPWRRSLYVVLGSIALSLIVATTIDNWWLIPHSAALALVGALVMITGGGANFFVLAALLSMNPSARLGLRKDPLSKIAEQSMTGKRPRLVLTALALPVVLGVALILLSFV